MDEMCLEIVTGTSVLQYTVDVIFLRLDWDQFWDMVMQYRDRHTVCMMVEEGGRKKERRTGGRMILFAEVWI